MDKSLKDFSVLSTKLNTGINLIEASAGTGKTYSLEFLILRCLLEKEINLEEILVTTFTIKAVYEIKHRLTKSLDTIFLFSVQGKQDSLLDVNLQKLIDNIVANKGAEFLEIRLKKIHANLDKLQVFTIDGFVQKVLKDNFFILKHFKDSEIVANKEIKDLIFNLSKRFIDRLEADFPGYAGYFAAKTLISLRDFIDLQAIHLSDAGFADDVFSSYFFDSKEGYEQAVKLIGDNHRSFKTLYTLSLSDNFLKAEYVNFLEIINEVAHLKDVSKIEIRHLNLFSDFKSSYLQKKHLKAHAQFFDDFFAIILEIKELFTKVEANLNQAFLYFVKANLVDYLLDNDLLTFSLATEKLATALREKVIVVEALNTAYKAVFIDEFQDTNTYQWQIFKLFSVPQQSNLKQRIVFLVGDPKQSIYKFRGADLKNYLKVAAVADYKYSLGMNYRSRISLVDEVNLLFSKDKVFLEEKMIFLPVEADKKSGLNLYKKNLNEIVAASGLAIDRLVTSDGKPPASTAWIDVCAAKILELLNGDFIFFDESCSGEAVKVLEQDIAILVNKNDEVFQIQKKLKTLGIKVSATLTESEIRNNNLFEMAIAEKFWQLISAIYEPSFMQTQSLLSILWFDKFLLDNKQIAVNLDDDFVSKQLEVFIKGNEILNSYSLSAALEYITNFYDVYDNLIYFANANCDSLFQEEILNLEELIIYVRNLEATDNLLASEIYKKLYYLIKSYDKPDYLSSKRLLDDTSVKVMNVHQAKGLEFKIVLMPCMLKLNSRSLKNLSEDEILAKKQELMRQTYVAFTRAKYFVWSLISATTDFTWVEAVSIDESKIKSIKPEDYAINSLLEKNRDSKSIEPNSWFDFINLSARLKDKKVFFNLPQTHSFSSLNSELKKSCFNLKADAMFDTTDSISLKESFEDFETAVTSKFSANAKHFGLAVHKVLEDFDFDYFNLMDEQTLKTSKARLKLETIFLNYGIPKEMHESVLLSIKNLLNSELAEYMHDGFSLVELPKNHLIKEFRFKFKFAPNANFNFMSLLDLIKNDASFPDIKLKEIEIKGFLTGFIDLIFKHDNKYYISDYKSNFLKDYSHEYLRESMAKNNYGLQYLIYTLALDNYLRATLCGYNYEENFGGVFYFYTRAFEKLNVTMGDKKNGIFFHKPKCDIISYLGESLYIN